MFNDIIYNTVYNTGKVHFSLGPTQMCNDGNDLYFSLRVAHLLHKPFP